MNTNFYNVYIAPTYVEEINSECRAIATIYVKDHDITIIDTTQTLLNIADGPFGGVDIRDLNISLQEAKDLIKCHKHYSLNAIKTTFETVLDEYCKSRNEENFKFVLV